MAHAGKLQGWVTLRGPDSGTIVQEEDQWLDLWDYDDVVIWCQITDQSNVDSLALQTAPVKEEDMFLTMATALLSPTSGPRITTVAFSSATTPLARYVRWKCTSREGSGFSLTFRAWVVASGRSVPPGVIALAPSRLVRRLDEADDASPADDEQAELDEDAFEAVLTASTADEGAAGDQDGDEDERAWKTWRPPLLFAGPSTARVPGLERSASDLATAMASRRAATAVQSEEAPAVTPEGVGTKNGASSVAEPHVQVTDGRQRP